MEAEGLLEVKCPNDTTTQGEVLTKVHCAKGTLLSEDWEQQPLVTSKHNSSSAPVNYWSRQECNTGLVMMELWKDGQEGEEMRLSWKWSTSWKWKGFFFGVKDDIFFLLFKILEHFVPHLKIILII